MECPNCKTPLTDGTNFCNSCGATVNQTSADNQTTQNQVDPNQYNQYNQGYYSQVPPYNAQQGYMNTPMNQYYAPQQMITEDYLPEQYRPMGAWAYWGLQLLFAIPVIGFIFLIIFSCSNGNINRRNFARSYWCSLILIGIILLVYLIIALVIGGGIYMSDFNLDRMF